jgi:hypothetical protein
MDVIPKDMVCSLWGGQYVGWMYKEANGALGGILLMWDRKVVEKKEECIGCYTLACSFQNVEDQFEWAFGGCMDRILMCSGGSFGRSLLV